MIKHFTINCHNIKIRVLKCSKVFILQISFFKNENMNHCLKWYMSASLVILMVRGTHLLLRYGVRL